MNKLKNKVVLIITLIGCLIALTSLIGLTIAWQTMEKSNSGDFIMGEVRSTLKVDNVSVTESPFNIEINDLVYIDIKKDFSKEMINLIGKEIKLEIKNDGDLNSGNINVRNLIKLTNSQGLIYFIFIGESAMDYSNNIKETIDSLSLTTMTDENEIRNLINNRNTTLLKNLYETKVSQIGTTTYISLVIFGDYNALTDELKNTYKTNLYELTIEHCAIQVDYNNNTPSYENDEVIYD